MNSAQASAERLEARATMTASKHWSRGWVGVAVVLLLCPLWLPLLMVAMVIAVVVGLPFAAFDACITQPLKLRKWVVKAGRTLDESECIARLERGQGTLLIEHRGGKNTRAWWTPDAVQPLPANLSEFDEDLHDDEMPPEVFEAVQRNRHAIEKYTDIRSGSALLVRRARGEQLGKQLAAVLGPDRTVTLHTWALDLWNNPLVCGICEYDLTGLEGSVCPECGAQVRRDPAPNPPFPREEASGWVQPRRSTGSEPGNPA